MRLTQSLRFKLLRRHVFFNNEYQKGRLRRVKNLDVRQSLEERGIAVAEPQVRREAGWGGEGESGK